MRSGQDAQRQYGRVNIQTGREAGSNDKRRNVSRAEAHLPESVQPLQQA
jgi:hypothetical protein